MEVWIPTLVKIAALLLSALISTYVIPWLHEKRLYETVRHFVEGAEQWNKRHPIDKKQWVIDRLTESGIKVTPTIDALIEAAVMELDLALGK